MQTVTVKITTITIKICRKILKIMIKAQTDRQRQQITTTKITHTDKLTQQSPQSQKPTNLSFIPPTHIITTHPYLHPTPTNITLNTILIDTDNKNISAREHIRILHWKTRQQYRCLQHKQHQL